MSPQERRKKRQQAQSAAQNKAAVNGEIAVSEEFEALSVKSDRRSELILIVSVAIVAFLIFLRTVAPGLIFGDGTELTTAAYVLGVPHPTGYPLYMMLLHLWLKLPLGEVIARANLFSVLCASGTVAISVRIWRRVLTSLLPKWPLKAHLLGAASIALFLGFLRNSWENSIVAEVYALQLLFTVGFLFTLQRFEETRKPSNLVAAAVVFGLALTHHRLSVTLALPLAMAFWWAKRRVTDFPWRRSLTSALLAVLACQSLYLYLPIRAAAQPPINWGNPVTFAAFLNHVRGGEYMQFQLLQAFPGRPFSLESYMNFFFLTLRHLIGEIATQVFPATVQFVTDVFPRPFAVPSAPFFVLGLCLIIVALFSMRLWAKIQPLTAMGAALVVLQNLVVIFIYNIADIRDYYLFVMWVVWGSVCVGALVGLQALLQRFISRALRPEYAYAFLLLPLLPLTSNFSRCDMSKSDEPEVFAQLVMPNRTDAMPENSILITMGDDPIFLSWYRQLVRRERTDVLVFGANFASRAWYRTFFTPSQIEKYQIRFADRIAQGAAEFAEQVSNAIIERNVGRYPIFTTIDDPLVLQELSKRYTLKLVAQQVFVMRSFWGPEPVRVRRIEPKRF